MQSEENKNTWISLFIIVGCVILLLVFSIFQLSPLIKATMQDWSTIQNSSSITQNDKDKLNASLDTLKTIGVFAGPISTLAGAFVLFLNFTVGNRTAKTAYLNVQLAESRLITERFSEAVEQLGSDTLEVCLGGIYSLEKIATDSNSAEYYYGIVMEILVAFIRETSNLIDEDIKNNAKKFSTIQVALTVVGRLNSNEFLSSKSFKSLSLNLICAKLNDFEFIGNFSRINFRGANLDGAYIYNANFNYCFFHNASFKQACIRNSDFQAIDFLSSNFTDADLIESNFQDSNFHMATFENANLIQSNFQNSSFQKAIFTNTYLYESNFKNSVFIDIEQIKAARNYETAIYDDDLRQRLNIPKN